MSQIYPEANLYRQLAQYNRLLGFELAVNKIKDPTKREDASKELAPIRSALDSAHACVSKIQGKSKYRWVNMSNICA